VLELEIPQAKLTILGIVDRTDRYVSKDLCCIERKGMPLL
jgi:hypothetical protein